MFNLLEQTGVEIPNEARNPFLRGVGTAKVIWTGAKSNGNVKIHLFKSMLCTIQWLKVAVAIVGFIGQSYPVVALSAMKMIFNTIAVGNIKHGRVYTISGWKYKGVVNQ